MTQVQTTTKISVTIFFSTKKEGGQSLLLPYSARLHGPRSCTNKPSKGVERENDRLVI